LEFKRVRHYFITGLFVLIPIALTIWVVIATLSFVNNLFLPYLRYILPIPDIPGIGVLITLAIVFAVGFLAENYFGKKIIELWDTVVCKIPFVRTIYSATKQTMESLFSKKKNFSKTVFVRFPDQKSLSIGFVANKLQMNGEWYYAVYVPTAPNPTSGYTIFYKVKDVIPTNLTVDEATKIILSGGLAIKKDIKFLSEDEQGNHVSNDKDEPYSPEEKQQS